MGKRLITQRRGKGGSTYRSPSHRHVGRISLPMKGGKVMKMIHAPGRNSPVAVLDSGEMVIASYNISTDRTIKVHETPSATKSVFEVGDVHRLRNLPEGTEIHNIELRPNDGGVLARSNGSFAKIIQTTEDRVMVKLGSGKMKILSGNCRAAIGRVAGSGVNDINIAKAGLKKIYFRSRSKRSFKVSGISMNPVNHPHGGGNHPHVGVNSSVSRNAPPGRKVGLLAPQKKKKIIKLKTE